jgi:hypothetical protein
MWQPLFILESDGEDKFEDDDESEENEQEPTKSTKRNIEKVEPEENGKT